MTLKEFGENLEKLNEAYEQLRKKYQKPEIGKTIDVSGIKWLVLDKLEKGYLVISNEFYGCSRKFDSDCNDWKSSDLRNELTKTCYQIYKTVSLTNTCTNATLNHLNIGELW